MRVLFPTDGSVATEAAFENLLDLLGEAAQQARITVLNVTDQGFETADHEYVEKTFEDDERDEVFPSEEASKRAVQRCVEIGQEHGVDVSTKIVEGTYKDEILEEAEGYDVLAMHELRSSNWLDRLKMSATESLARNAPCSVLLVETDELG
jgi:nucleotide-binding universal stress UspA family protein